MPTLSLLRARLAPLVLLAPLALACGDKDASEDDDDDGGGSGSADDTAASADDTGEPEECGGSAPVVVDLSCRNGGMQSSGSGEQPTLEFTAEVSDEDGDLTAWTMVVVYDGTPDGTLTGASELGSTTGGSGVDCEVPTAQARSTWFVDGAALPYSTTYDFGVVITDANGESSEAAVITCQTPGDNGLGGGEVEPS